MFSKFSQSTPIVFQSEFSECALACIAMVASFHGNKTDINQLRNRFSLSTAGTSLREIIDVLGELGLGARTLRLELEDLKYLKTPAILHWGMSHYVVLTKVSKHHVTVHDPDLGKVKYSFNEVDIYFTGFAIEANKLGSFVTTDDRDPLTLRELFSFSAFPVTRTIILAIFILFVQSISIMIPLTFQYIVDSAIIEANKKLLITLTSILMLTILLEGFLNRIKEKYLLEVGIKINLSITGKVFNHLLKLPLIFFETRNIGDLNTKLDAVNEIRRVVSQDAIKMFTEALTAIVLVTVMLYTCGLLLTSFVIAAITLFVIFRQVTWTRMYINAQDCEVRKGEEHSHLIETIKNIHTIKNFNVEFQRLSQWQNKFANLSVSEMNIEINRLDLRLAGEFGSKVVQLLVMAFGGYMTIEGEITLGTLIAALFFSRLAAFTGVSFVEALFKLKMLRVQLERIADIVKTAPEVDLPSCGITTKEGVDLTLEQVKYSYRGAKNPVFKDISFTINYGEHVAIVGKSGVGKTTLLNCITGVLNGFEGHIKISGYGIEQLSKLDKKRVFASVSQSDTLFIGSLYENLCMYDSDVTDEVIKKALIDACIYDEVMDLPMRLYTRVGDLGSGLSAGQEQRILIARALIKSPLILIMDEGTANLDVVTESEILTNLRARGLTVIHAAHRTQVIESVDFVCNMNMKFTR